MPGRFLRVALTALITVAAAGVPILGAALPASAATFTPTVQETPYTNTWSPWKACTAAQGGASDNCAEVHAMAQLGNTVYIGGDFTELRAAGQPSITGLGGFAAIDATTHQPITSVQLPRFKNTSGIAVRAIAVDPVSSTIYVGGGFNYAAFGAADFKITYQRLVAFTPAGTLIGAYNPNLVVNALTVSGGKLYAGGSFTSLRTSPTDTTGVPVHDAAAIDLASGAVDPTWAPNFTVQKTSASAIDSMKVPAVTALAVAHGRIYVGGHFDHVGPAGGGTVHIMIAAVNPVTGAADESFQGVTNPINYDQHYWSVMSIATVGNVGDSNAGVLAATGGLTNRTYHFNLAGKTIWQFIADGDSQAVAVDGDDVYIGGHFVCVGAYSVPIQGSCTPPKGNDPVAGDAACVNADPAKMPTCFYDPSDAVVNRTHIAVVSYSQTVTTTKQGLGTFVTPRLQVDPGGEPWNPQLNPSTSPYYFGVWDLTMFDGELWVGGVWKTLVVPTGPDIPKDTAVQTYVSYPSIQKFAIFPTVNSAPALPSTTVSLSSSQSPSTAGTAITFTADVAAITGSVVPTGSVQFSVDGTDLGSAQTLSGGSASISTSTLTAGAHTVTATYGGSGAFAGSSGSLPGGQTVNAVAVVGPLSLSVSDVTVLEGDSGTTNASFAVTLSGAPASGKPVTVTAATSDGTALAGSDYTALAPTTLTWNAGDALTKTVNVPVLGDTRPEGNENFHLNLSAPGNATLADASGLGTIADEEGPVTYYVNDTSKVEGNSGTAAMNFTVTSSPAPAPGQSVTVKVKTTAGTAKAGSDFKAVALHAITFTSAVPTQTVAVPIIGDKAVESNETVFLTLSAPSAGTVIGDAGGLGTIINDDGEAGVTPAPALTVGNTMVVEGNSGTSNALFDVSLPAPPTQTTSVHVATANGTATAGSDYSAVNTTVTWAPGDPATKTVSVSVLGDTIGEPNETFSLVLSSPVNAALADSTAVGTIVDEEGVPTISIGDSWLVEGNSGTSPMTFAVTLSQPAQQTVTIKYATAAGTASGSSDFTGASGKVITWAPGDALTKLITVPIKGDKTVEANETFKINLSGVTGGATVADGQAIGTILNDD